MLTNRLICIDRALLENAQWYNDRNWCCRRRNRGPSQIEVNRRSERRYFQSKNHWRVSDRWRRVRVSSWTISTDQANPRQRSPDRHLWVEIYSAWKKSLTQTCLIFLKKKAITLLIFIRIRVSLSVTSLNDKIRSSYGARIHV